MKCTLCILVVNSGMSMNMEKEELIELVKVAGKEKQKDRLLEIIAKALLEE